MIPQIVHYVWVGPRPLPSDAVERIAEWRALMPHWRFMRWDEETIDFQPMFIRQALGMRAYNRVANYARLAALRDHGGFYLDHDIRLLKPLDPFCRHRGVLGFQSDVEQFDIVNNAVIGSVPQHPFVLRALRALDEMDGGYDWGSGTGPRLISRLLRESDAIRPSNEPVEAAGMMLFPTTYFYPYSWTASFDETCIRPETVAVHLWEHTWKRRPGALERARWFARRCLTKLAPTLRSRWVRAADMRSKRRVARHANGAAEGFALRPGNP